MTSKDSIPYKDLQPYSVFKWDTESLKQTGGIDGVHPDGLYEKLPSGEARHIGGRLEIHLTGTGLDTLVYPYKV